MSAVLGCYNSKVVTSPVSEIHHPNLQPEFNMRKPHILIILTLILFGTINCAIGQDQYYGQDPYYQNQYWNTDGGTGSEFAERQLAGGLPSALLQILSLVGLVSITGKIKK